MHSSGKSQGERGGKKRGLRRPLAEIKSAEAKRISRPGETLSIGYDGIVAAVEQVDRVDPFPSRIAGHG
jgi:hypothetical protein